MKKIIVWISFLCYFAATSGIVISSHYCMKRLASVHLFETSADLYGSCEMEASESDGCCRDEVKLLKLIQDQDKLSVENCEIPAMEKTVSIPSEFIVTPFENIGEQRHFHNHSPPLLSEQDTYLQNSVFRI